MPDKRVRVRVNGRADGGVLVLVGLDMTDEEFIAAAAFRPRLCRRPSEAPTLRERPREATHHETL